MVQYIAHGFLSQPKKEDLAVLKKLIEAGTVTPVIDRTYPLSEVPEAMRYLESGTLEEKSSSPCEAASAEEGRPQTA